MSMPHSGTCSCPDCKALDELHDTEQDEADAYYAELKARLDERAPA